MSDLRDATSWPAEQAEPNEPSKPSAELAEPAERASRAGRASSPSEPSEPAEPASRAGRARPSRSTLVEFGPFRHPKVRKMRFRVISLLKRYHFCFKKVVQMDSGFRPPKMVKKQIDDF